MGTKFNGMIAILDNTGTAFSNLMKVFSGGKPDQGSLLDWVTTLSAGLGQIVFYLTQMAEGVKAMLDLDFAKAADISFGYGQRYQNFVAGQNAALNAPRNQAIDQTETKRRNVTININKGNVTAKEIAKAVNKGTKVTGSPSMSPAAIRRAGAR